jgi:hypothetical protein
MENFSIKIFDPKIVKHREMPCCTGEIQIGDFQETFMMPLEYWSMHDYVNQWKEGIERLKTHNKTCLVTELQDPARGPLAMIWSLYKKGRMVYIRNHFLFGKSFARRVKKKPFNAQTCYDFVGPRGKAISLSGLPISEWDIDLESVLKFNPLAQKLSNKNVPSTPKIMSK